MKGSYIFEYLNENEFKKLERSVKKYNMLAYKKLVFDYYPSYDEIKTVVNTGQFDNEQAQAINFIKTIINSV